MIWTIVILFFFLIATWMTTMYILWSTEQGKEHARFTDHSIAAIVRTVRTLRRYLYATRRWLLVVLKGIKTSALYLFFIVFPNAKKAFRSHDELTGLTKGPSSYFLMSVSEYTEEAKKVRPKRGRNKKNV
jgi:hypothetical protein